MIDQHPESPGFFARLVDRILSSLGLTAPWVRYRTRVSKTVNVRHFASARARKNYYRNLEKRKMRERQQEVAPAIQTYDPLTEVEEVGDDVGYGYRSGVHHPAYRYSLTDTMNDRYGWNVGEDRSARHDDRDDRDDSGLGGLFSQSDEDQRDSGFGSAWNDGNDRDDRGW